jgi:ligand-binding sensor domain-containing protein
VRVAVLLLLLAVIVVSLAVGGVGEWKVYTAKNNVRAAAIDFQDSLKLWIATSGGMFTYRLDDSSFQQYTTAEGLRTNDLTAISVDSHGNVWIGASDGFLHRYTPGTDEWQYITDIYFDNNHGANKRINGFQISGDTLFILSEIGVSIFSISRMEFGDTYTMFGSPDSQIAGNVTGVQMFNDRLWVSTTAGIASTPLSNVNPSSPETWQIYTTNEGLPSRIVHRLEIHRGTLLAATALGLASFNGIGWVVVPATMNLNIIDFKSSSSVCSDCSSYFITSNNQLWEVSDTADAHLVRQFSSQLSSLTSPAVFGTISDGLLVIKNETTQAILPPGPPTNKFVGIVVDQKGVLWSGTGKSSGIGFMSFNGTTWNLYTKAQYPVL